MPHCQRTLITAIPRAVPVMTMVPVPWSLAWCEDGELAPQDRLSLEDQARIRYWKRRQQCLH
jgi:hypothetical protein